MTWNPEIQPGTEKYLERLDAATAIQSAKETVEEWDYESDKHGYCHERTMLIRLIQAAER